VEVFDTVDQERMSALLARGERFWLALLSPDPATIREAGELLGLHRLAIQDSLEFGQRPKIDDYPGSALLVFFGARSDGRHGRPLPVPVEVHFHVTARAIMTVRHHDMGQLDDARRRVSLADVDTAEEALYRVLDALVSSFRPELQAVDREVDAIEDVLLDDPRPDVRLRLLDLKHALVRLRQVIDPQRDVLAGHRDLLEALPDFHDPGAHDVLRDIYDRLAIISQQTDVVRESISNALDLYVSSVSNRLNEIMKVLTIVATFFLPLTFLTGFFGQNFGWMVRHIGSAGAFFGLGVGLGLVFVVTLLTWFSRAGYVPRLRPHSRGTARAAPRP
jgi:magnesium transporter